MFGSEGRLLYPVLLPSPLFSFVLVLLSAELVALLEAIPSVQVVGFSPMPGGPTFLPMPGLAYPALDGTEPEHSG